MVLLQMWLLLSSTLQMVAEPLCALSSTMLRLPIELHSP
jgi:hypothetical protein